MIPYTQINRKINLLTSALEIIKKGANGYPYSSQAELARAANISEANLSRWLNGTATPTLKKLEPVLFALGVTLQLPKKNEELYTQGSIPQLIVKEDEDNKTINLLAHDNSMHISQQNADNYVLVPLVGEIGPGAKKIPFAEEVDEWIPISIAHYKTNMFMVRLGKNEHSMQPMLYPNDLVLIDGTPHMPITPMSIYLVQTPPSKGNSFLLKRVMLTTKNTVTTHIVYYSDNTQEGYQPQVYPLSIYNDLPIHKIIFGRVISFWGNMDVRIKEKNK